MRISKGSIGGGYKGAGTYPYSLGIWMIAIVFVGCDLLRGRLFVVVVGVNCSDRMPQSRSERIGQLLYVCRVARHSFVKPSRCP
jgi:hypothetical protein